MCVTCLTLGLALNLNGIKSICNSKDHDTGDRRQNPNIWKEIMCDSFVFDLVFKSSRVLSGLISWGAPSHWPTTDRFYITLHPSTCTTFWHWTIRCYNWWMWGFFYMSKGSTGCECEGTKILSPWSIYQSPSPSSLD